MRDIVGNGEEVGLIERSRLGLMARRVLARVAADPPHRFTLAGLATELGTSRNLPVCAAGVIQSPL
jgi:hypothetical protein